MSNKKQDFPESFGDARKNFKVNLKAVLSHLDYTATTLALKLNTICESSMVATSEIYSWLDGTTIPCVYHLYKMSNWLNISMGQLFSTNFNASTILGQSFAKPIITSIPLISIEIVSEEKPMTTKTNTVAISKASKTKMTQVVTARTTSKTYNLLLANKIWSSDMLLKDVATKANISTRSLRNYAFDGASVPADVAQSLVKMFKTSYHSLGLKLNQDTGRYEALSVRIKA